MSNAALATAVIEECLAWGARDFVVCAGARNAPLVLPLLQAPPPARVWRHFDERSAAFFALGLAKREERPVAVVTTSGTAAAELLPAAVEAHYSGAPLLLVTADRPKRFRATGAPQAIEQAGLFGPYAEGCLDAEAAEDFPRDFPWNRSRPLHLNPCFEEPGAEAAACPDWPGAAARARDAGAGPGSAGDEALLERFLAEFADGLVVLGDIAAADRAAVADFLARLGAPVWAEASSGLRESALLGELLVRGGDAAFREWRPRKVLRLGGVPSLRLWRDLEDRPGVPVLSVTRTGFPGLARPCQATGWLDFRAVALPGGLKTKGLPPIQDDGVEDFPRSEPALVRRLSERVPESALVFLGNSLPIREWNLAACLAPPHPRVRASRGANGIDGQVSTFLGLSEGEAESWGIFGDLTALCELQAPWVLDQLSPGKRRLVVVNNGGGRIFSRLPALAGLGTQGKRVTENRHGKDFAAWAALWDLEYRVAREAGDLADSAGWGASVLLELKPDEEETEAWWGRKQGG